jgi:hypothetical protein
MRPVQEMPDKWPAILVKTPTLTQRKRLVAQPAECYLRVITILNVRSLNYINNE